MLKLRMSVKMLKPRISVNTVHECAANEKVLQKMNRLNFLSLIACAWLGLQSCEK